MDQVILDMLAEYNNRTDDNYANSLKQIMQQIALLGLWRAKFFEYAAFYGGTALRILFNLDRFSEDLDFSLLKHFPEFNLESYLQAIQAELESFGFSTEIAMKQKNIETDIQPALIKANTHQHLIKVKAPKTIQERTHGHKFIKIKLEIDTDPPLGFTTETIPLLRPIPFWVKSFSLPDLFAGKLAAVICRQWKQRVKGRDWYDFLWFVQQKIPVHLAHLETRLRYYGAYNDSEPLSLEKMKKILNARIETLDIKLAKDDIAKFIRHPNRLDSWSKELFHAVTEKIQEK